MKVKDLIKQLESEDPERIVVMAKDGEGNGYSPTSDYWLGIYVPDSTWSGAVFCERDGGKPPEGYGEEDCYDGEDGQPALILCPVN